MPKFAHYGIDGCLSPLTRCPCWYCPMSLQRLNVSTKIESLSANIL